VLLGNGDGSFQEPVKYPADPGPTSLATDDLNGDGVLDLVVSNSLDVTVLMGNGDGTFQSHDFGHFSFAQFVAIADFNHDENPDLAVADSNGFAISLGRGDGTFLAPRYFSVPNFVYGPERLAVGDFNNDQNPDVAFSMFSLGGVYVFDGKGDGTFRQGVLYLGGVPLSFVTASDVNGDGAPDLLTAALYSDVFVALNTGN
jgi:hypothetical protein